MEAKQERPKLDTQNQALEKINKQMSGNLHKQMSGNLGTQSPRFGGSCAKLVHLAVQDGDGMRRVPSEGKINCLCSPTTHAGSFRCRLHRTASNMTSNNSSSGGRSFNSLSNLAGAHD
ncbi:hypothetical protein L2E82_38118 [Cichorium intybus]|uniref:Uncharacterized protein n=1 Tax=Cichorium intybus TaxID=13427 RepID=A0ACB9AEZ9_CICIN|nr:hypothetical protein L2E82_38118 [Cichorium intybus]